MRNKEYLAVKNLIHNELKLTKEELKIMIVEATKDEAKAQVKKYIQKGADLDKIIKEQIFKEVTSVITGRSYDRSREEFFKNLGIEMAKNLNISLKM